MPKLTIAEGTASFEVTVLVLESTLCSNVVLFAVGAGGNVERLFRFSLFRQHPGGQSSHLYELGKVIRKFLLG
jgi:hypothetical protein